MLDVSKLDRSPLSDVCRNKHGGRDSSEEANAKVHSKKESLRQKILSYADFMGGRGITVKEVCRDLNLKHQTASARLAELKADLELVAKGVERRDGCGVFVRPKSGQLSLI